MQDMRIRRGEPRSRGTTPVGRLGETQISEFWAYETLEKAMHAGGDDHRQVSWSNDGGWGSGPKERLFDRRWVVSIADHMKMLDKGSPRSNKSGPEKSIPSYGIHTNAAQLDSCSLSQSSLFCVSGATPLRGQRRPLRIRRCWPFRGKANIPASKCNGRVSCPTQGVTRLHTSDE